MTRPDLDAIRDAHRRIAPYIHRTPVIDNAAVDRRAGARVAMKCEHLQRVGAFKARGALNAILSLEEAEARRGVATHSSGNHGAAVAMAAAVRGIPAHIVMPDNSARVKLAAVGAYGGQVELCAPSLAAREAGLAAVVERTGAIVVHPYDDWRIIAGQGTAALELVEARPDLEALLVPVGGGGLSSGTALALAGAAPGIAVYGVEPAGADDAARGLAAGERVRGAVPDTIADGLRSELGERNFEVLHDLGVGILTVTDAAIVEAMRFMLERTKQLIEPSAATVIAALFADGSPFRGKRVGVILSGGNADLDNLPWRVT